MPIQWNPDAVREALDEVEFLVQEVYPPLNAAIVAAQLAQQLPNLPQYMTQSLESVERNLKAFKERVATDLEHARKQIPDTPAARPRQDAGPTLFP